MITWIAWICVILAGWILFAFGIRLALISFAPWEEMSRAMAVLLHTAAMAVFGWGCWRLGRGKRQDEEQE